MLALAQPSGDDERTAVARDCLADATTASGDLPESIALVHTALANQRRQLGAERGHTLMNLCAAMLLSGDEAPARALSARELPLLRLNLYAGVLFNHLSLLAARTNDVRLAARLLGHADRWYADNQSPHRQATQAMLLDQSVLAIDAAPGPAEREGVRRVGAAAHRRRGRRAGLATAGPAAGPAAG